MQCAAVVLFTKVTLRRVFIVTISHNLCQALDTRWKCLPGEFIWWCCNRIFYDSEWLMSQERKVGAKSKFWFWIILVLNHYGQHSASANVIKNHSRKTTLFKTTSQYLGTIAAQTPTKMMCLWAKMTAGVMTHSRLIYYSFPIKGAPLRFDFRIEFWHLNPKNPVKMQKFL